MANVTKNQPAEEGTTVKPCCTHCRGTTYSYRREVIADIEGLLVYCSTCGGIFSWSPNIRSSGTAAAT